MYTPYTLTARARRRAANRKDDVREDVMCLERERNWDRAR